MFDLYPCFKHLNNYNTIWVYADPHFGDEEMELYRRNYIDDDEQVKRINSKVGKKDVIFILGDIGDAEYVKRIRGYKILVMGNHDRGKSYYQRRIVDGEDNHLFDEVYSGIVMLNDKLLLSHEPVTGLPFVFNIHGHNHNDFQRKDDNTRLNVCAEYIDYTPVNINSIIKNGMLKNVTSIHRFAIEEANERKKYRLLAEEWGKDFCFWHDIFTKSDSIPPYVFKDSDVEYPCLGYLTFKGDIYPIYDDDYGAEIFIIYRYYDENNDIKDYCIPVDHMGGMIDWWFELNRMRYEYPNEIKYDLKTLIGANK